MAAIDPLALCSVNGESSPRHFAIVTPDDANDLPTVCRCFSFGTAGALKVTTAGGETVVIPSGQFAAGQWHSGQFARIWSTGTTATDIMVGW